MAILVGWLTAFPRGLVLWFNSRSTWSVDWCAFQALSGTGKGWVGLRNNLDHGLGPVLSGWKGYCA